MAKKRQKKQQLTVKVGTSEEPRIMVLDYGPKPPGTNSLVPGIITPEMDRSARAMSRRAMGVIRRAVRKIQQTD